MGLFVISTTWFEPTAPLTSGGSQQPSPPSHSFESAACPWSVFDESGPLAPTLVPCAAAAAAFNARYWASGIDGRLMKAFAGFAGVGRSGWVAALIDRAGAADATPDGASAEAPVGLSSLRELAPASPDAGTDT